MTAMDTMAQGEPADTGRRPFDSFLLKAAMAVVGLVVLIALGRHLGGYVPKFANWVESVGIWGPLVFILGYALATVAFIPGSLLTLAAGATFGLLKGSAFVFAGATLGSALAFLVARYLARAPMERRIEKMPRFAAVDRAVAEEGLKIVFLLRLSPVFPYNLLNYALGLTRVRFRHYVAASIGMIPGTFLYVYYGKALGSLAAVAGGARIERGAEYWGFLAIGLVATLAVTTFVTRIARRALKQEVANG